MRTPLKLLLAALIALMALPAAALAGDRHDRHRGGWHGVGHGALAPISAADFLTRAAQGNRFEIASGQLAQERANSPELRTLGALLVRDHTALQQQGDAVAAQLGITVPAGLHPKQQALLDRLARLSGDDFDRAWLRAQLWAHKQALALHLRGAIRGEAPEIRTLAQGALPAIANHLGHVLDLLQARHDGDAADRWRDRWDDDDRGDRHGARHGDKRGHDRGRGHDSRRGKHRR